MRKSPRKFTTLLFKLEKKITLKDQFIHQECNNDAMEPIKRVFVVVGDIIVIPSDKYHIIQNNNASLLKIGEIIIIGTIGILIV